ncbi:MAG: hypothetical protein IPN61_17355 [Bacteroidetes bacterium]|nr:hypothetical protein [Bacteroidota bacterium]
MVTGNVNGQQITVSPIINSTYDVIVTDTNGCTASDQINVVVNNLPVAYAGPDQSICHGTTTTLVATGGNSFSGHREMILFKIL